MNTGTGRYCMSHLPPVAWQLRQALHESLLCFGKRTRTSRGAEHTGAQASLTGGRERGGLLLGELGNLWTCVYTTKLVDFSLIQSYGARFFCGVRGVGGVWCRRVVGRECGYGRQTSRSLTHLLIARINEKNRTKTTFWGQSQNLKTGMTLKRTWNCLATGWFVHSAQRQRATQLRRLPISLIHKATDMITK